MSETMWVLWDNFFYCVKYHKLIFSFSISLTLFKIFQKVSCCLSSSVRHFKCLIYVEYEYTIKGMREALHIQEYLTWAVKMETCWWLVFHHWIHFQNWQGGFRGKIELLFLVLSLIRMTLQQRSRILMEGALLICTSGKLVLVISMCWRPSSFYIYAVIMTSAIHI